MEMLTPNKQGSAEYISKNNYSMTCFICLVIVAQGTILALISLIDSNYAVVFSTLAYTLLMLAKNVFKQEFYEGDNKELPELIEKINTRFNVEKGEVDTFLTGKVWSLQRMI